MVKITLRWFNIDNMVTITRRSKTMTTLLAIVAAWFLISLPISLLIGRYFARHNRRAELAFINTAHFSAN
jgi:hypothetical protein